MKEFFTLLYYRKLRNSRYMQRLGIVLIYLILTAIILPRSFRLQYQFEVGQPWRNADLYAPFDFAIYKTQDSILEEQAAVVEDVVPIFERDTSEKALSLTSIQQTLVLFYNNVEAYEKAQKNRDTSSQTQLRQSFFSAYPVNLEEAIEHITLFEPERTGKKSLQVFEQIYDKGYVDAIPDTLPDVLAKRLSEAEEEHVAKNSMIYPSTLEKFIYDQRMLGHAIEKQIYNFIFVRALKPNYAYSQERTEDERTRVKNLISPVYGKVNARSLIVEKGTIVDKKTGEVIESLIREKEKRVGNQTNWSSFISKVIIILLITMILLGYLSVNKPRVYFNNTKLILILFIFLIAIGGMALATRLMDFVMKFSELGSSVNLSFIYLAPSCIVPIFISNFFGHRVGFLCNLLTALYGAVLVEQSLEFAFVQIMAGTVAVFSLRRIRKREIFFYTLLYIFLAYTISYIAFNLYSQGGLSEINYSNISLFGINVALTIIAYNLIYVFEKIFRLTSDLTYLELLDTNHPLLQQMARKAPGTFQHSLQVANIAESTINVIGGNGLLTHVGALYHDIGKIANPQFFIENQSDGYNPHNELACEESADKIIGHVKNGIELGQKYNLPREIIQFIETHHGSTRVEYFYRIHLKEKKCKAPEGEEQFRYPGPLPFSKETAVLMIADSIEAASRSLKKPTPEDIKKLVNGIIDHKIRDNQLEKSNLTFKDIATIRKVIVKQLMSIYHSRIEYPKEPEAEVVEK